MPDWKAMLDTPQKIRTAVLCGLVALATLAAVVIYGINFLGDGPQADADASPEPTGTASAGPSSSPDPDGSAQPSFVPAVGLTPTLSMEEARELALAEAGVEADQAEMGREALEEDNGIWVYEFHFSTPQARYEYKINANTGQVRGMVKEVLTSSQPSEPAAPAASQTPQTAAPQPSPSVPPAASAAPTGADSGPSGMYIGAERAKSAALSHAGLTNSQVMFTHVSMDRENGRTVYEIEFRQGGVEYEYQIDAATGQVLEHETDAD